MNSPTAVPESLEVAFDGAIVVVVCALSFVAVNRKQDKMISKRYIQVLYTRFVKLQQNRHVRLRAQFCRRKPNSSKLNKTSSARKKWRRFITT